MNELTGHPGVDRPGGLGTQRNSLVLAVGFLLLALLVMTIPFTTQVLDLSMALVLVAIPLSYGVLRKKVGRFDYMEFIYPASFLYFLFFGFSALYLKQNVMALQYRSLLYWLTPALALALVGYLAQMAGYLTVGRFCRPGPFAGLVPRGLPVYFLIGGIGFLGHLAGAVQERNFYMGREVSGVLSIGQQLAVFFFFTWFLVWYMVWSGRLDRTRRNILLSLFVPATLAVMYLKVGGKALAIIALVLPGIAYWYARRRMPWKFLVTVGLIGIFVIFPLYNTFRLQDQRMATADRLRGSLDQATGWDEGTYLDQSIRAFIERMGIITSVAAVLKDVPEHVDYRKGDTLVLAPIGIFVPRILWPGKPNINLGMEFGQTFNLVSYVDRTTKIAPSPVGEFYWNFGFPAVVIGMFLIGASYRYVYEKFGAPVGFDPIRKGIYIMLFLHLIHISGSFAGLVGVTVKSYVTLHVLLVVCRKVGLLVEEAPGAGSGEPA